MEKSNLEKFFEDTNQNKIDRLVKENEALKQSNKELIEALKLYIKAGIHQSTDFEIQSQAYNKASKALNHKEV